MIAWLRRQAAGFGLASLLLVTVVAAHYLPDNIAAFYPEAVQKGAANAWTKVFGHAEGFVLYLVAWALVPFKPIPRRLGCSAICAWGAAEHFMAAGCRLQFDMTRPPANPALYEGLCDAYTGLPVYMFTVLSVLTIFALDYTRKR